MIDNTIEEMQSNIIKGGNGSWQDFMQVCENGHILNPSITATPDLCKDYCSTCGGKAITKCANCGNFIPGQWHYTGRYIPPPTQPDVPTHCSFCGSAFPWGNLIKKDIAPLKVEDATSTLEELFSKFHRVAQQLLKRHKNRETISIKDEYDVQNLLHALLHLYFEDIRPEEWTPSYAGGSARMDFLLKNEKTVVEVKMTRDSLKHKEVGEQLIIDIAKYSRHAECKTLVCFIYDPLHKIMNTSGFIRDLEQASTVNMKVKIFIQPTM